MLYAVNDGTTIAAALTTDSSTFVSHVFTGAIAKLYQLFFALPLPDADEEPLRAVGLSIASKAESKSFSVADL